MSQRGPGSALDSEFLFFEPTWWSALSIAIRNDFRYPKIIVYISIRISPRSGVENFRNFSLQFAG